MSVGLKYFTESLVVGTVSRYDLLVAELVPDRRIVLISESGIITFTSEYELIDGADGGTEVTCVLRFAFKNFVLNMARPAIESMAKSRMQTDLELLNLMMAEGGIR
jgi:hypothetical protein